MVPSIVFFNHETDLNNYIEDFPESSEQIRFLCPFQEIGLEKLVSSKNELKLPSSSDGYIEGDPWKFIFNLNVVKNEYDEFFRIFEIIKNAKIDFHQFNQIHFIGYIDSQSKDEVKDFMQLLKASVSTFLPVYCWFIEKHNLDEIFIGDNNIHIVNRFISFLTNSRSRKFIEKFLPMDKNIQQLPFFNTLGNSKLAFSRDKVVKTLIEYAKFRNIQQYLYLPEECLVRLLNQDTKDGLLNFNSERFDEFLNQNLQKVPEVDISTIADSFFTDNDKYGFLINALQAENVNQLFKDELSRKSINGSINPVNLLNKNTNTTISEYYINLIKSNCTPENQSQLFLDDLERIFNHHKTSHFKNIEKTLLTSKDTILSGSKDILEKIIKELFSRKQKHNKINGGLTAEMQNNDYSNLTLLNAFLTYLLNSQSELIDTGLEKARFNISRIISELQNVRDRCNEILNNKDNILKSKPDYLKRLQEVDKAIDTKRTERNNLIFEFEKLIKRDKEYSFFSKNKYTLKARSIATAVLICLSLLAVTGILYALDLITIRTSIFLIIFSFLTSSGYLIFKMSVLNQKIKNCEAEYNKCIRNKKDMQDKIIEDQNMYFEARLDYYITIFALRTIKSLESFIQKKVIDTKIFWYYLLKQCTKSLQKYNDYERKAAYGEIQLLNKMQLKELFYRFNVEEYLLDDTDIIYKSFCEFETAGALQDKAFNPLLFEILIDSESPVIVLAKPEHANRCTYKKMDGEHVPFINFTSKSVSLEDVKQGDLGDCYFLASLAAVACQQPDYLFRMILQVEPDKFKVRFFQSDGNDLFVSVDSNFWTLDNNEPVYAKTGTNSDNIREIWTMLIEKAWASLNGGYANIEGESQKKLEYSHALTGISSKCVTIDNNINKEELRNEIISYFINQKTPITLGSKSVKDAFCDDGLVTGHMYTISKVTKDGRFDIFNPWNINVEGEGKSYKGVDMEFLINNFDNIFFMIFEDINKGYSLDMYLTTDFKSRFKNKEVLYLDHFFEEASKNQGWNNIFNNITLNNLLINGQPFKVSHSFEFLVNEIYRFSRPLMRKGWFGEYNKLNEHLRYFSVDAKVPQVIERIRKKNSLNIPYESYDSEECELTFYQILAQFNISDII